MKGIKKFTVATLLLSGFYVPQIAFADTTTVEQRLADLEQQVAILKRQIEVDKENVAAKAPETPIITANSKDGFSIKSPDDNFKLKVGGYVQADARIFTDNKKDATATTDTFIARRVRPIFSGTVAHDFDYYIMPDFSSSTVSIVDAYAEYKKYPGLKIRAGKFKQPFSLENLQSTTVTNFAELGLPANLYPNRDIGFQVGGSQFKDSVNYAVGIFDGAPDKGAATYAGDSNSDKEVAGRLFILPFKNTDYSLLSGLGVGYAFSYGHEDGTELPPGFASPGQITVFSYAAGVTPNGPHIRTSPQFYYYHNSFGLLGEYVSSQQDLARNGGSTPLIKDRINNSSWQLSSTYVLTGEFASYNGVTPRNDFNPGKGKWGAFELAGRFGELTIDHNAFDDGFANLNTSVSKETAWATGLNWYLNKNVKLLFDFERTNFKRGVALGVANNNRKPENVVTSRVQLSF